MLNIGYLALCQILYCNTKEKNKFSFFIKLFQILYKKTFMDSISLDFILKVYFIRVVLNDNKNL